MDTFESVYTYSTCIAVFQRRRKYNVPVQMCGHPELNQYIRDVLGSIRPLIEKQALDKVVLIVDDKVRMKEWCVDLKVLAYIIRVHS